MIRSLTVLAAILAFGVGTAGGVGVAQAKHGSDDLAHHTVRDDHAGAQTRSARHHERRHHHRHGGPPQRRRPQSLLGKTLAITAEAAA